MNNKLLFLCFSMAIFNSCLTNKIAHFEILNESSITIDSIKVSCSGTDYKQKSTLKNVLPNQIESITLDMNNIKKVDGNYFVELYIKNNKIEKAFGYYTNGMPTNSIYSLFVKKDTILIRERRK